MKVKIGEGGRVLVPAKVRRELGWKAGDTLLLSCGDDGKMTYRRWEGTDAELDCRDAADEIARLVRGVPERDTLSRMLTERHGISLDAVADDE